MKEVVVCFLLASVHFFQVFEGRPSFLPDLPSKLNINKAQNSPIEKVNSKKDVRKDTFQGSNKVLKADEQTPISEGRPSFLPDIPSENNINKPQISPDNMKANVEAKNGEGGAQNAGTDLKADDNIIKFPVLPLSETVNPLSNSEIKVKDPIIEPKFPIFIPGTTTVPGKTGTVPLEMVTPPDSQLVPNPGKKLNGSGNDILNEASKVLDPNVTGVDVIRPSVSEPRSVPEEPKEVVESYAPRRHPWLWFKKNSKLSFKEPIIDCLRSNIFNQLSVKIYEQQELIAEPRVLVKPVFNVVPILETEVTYREEKRKVIIMVSKEKDEERIIQSVSEVEDLVFDEVSGEKKKVLRLVPMTSTVIVKCVELVPEEFETTVKIPVFTQKNSSITMQTFTGAMVTEPVKVTTMGMIKKKTEGTFLTPHPKLENPQPSSLKE